MPIAGPQILIHLHIRRFFCGRHICRMVRQRHSDAFDAWITDEQQSGVKELRAFAKGLLKDAAAVRAGLSLIWSNGPTEGFIHRLKLVKR